MDCYTQTLRLRQRAIGSRLPRHLTNTWGREVNRELQVIDAAVAAVCSAEQIEIIRRAIKNHTQQGIFL